VISITGSTCKRQEC